MLAALVRDHLHLRSDVSAIQTATNIVVVMYDAELNKKVQRYGEAWDDAQKEAKATEQDGDEDLHGAAEEEGGGGTKKKTRKGDGKGKGRPHPLGCGKRVVAMVALGEWLAEKESSLAGNKQKDAVRQQLLVETQEMSDMVGSFRSKHKTFREDRPWLWTLSLRTHMKRQVQWEDLVGISIDKGVRIEAEHVRQSVEEEQLWGWLRRQ